MYYILLCSVDCDIHCILYNIFYIIYRVDWTVVRYMLSWTTYMFSTHSTNHQLLLRYVAKVYVLELHSKIFQLHYMYMYM